MRRGRVYYAKLARGRAMFIAPRLVPHFHALWGVRRADEARVLSRDARAVLKVLRSEWEMATADLRSESGVRDGKRFAQALDQLQAAMIVVPSEVLYEPRFTYIWTLAVGRFPDLLRRRVSRDVALREVARGFLEPRGPDRARRTGPRRRPVASRCRPRQPRARGRRHGGHDVAGRLRAVGAAPAAGLTPAGPSWHNRQAARRSAPGVRDASLHEGP